ncbi:MAG TPA: hypothetical protein VEO55_08850 [Candidatus Dormibacteraeota bacterium]|nr:hypothetical protein [Candidatus Dormibacteraeota bacterium]
MSSWFHKKGLARAIATIGATLVLFAQLIGAIHFHQGVVSHRGIVTAEISADQELCPVCQLAFHSPGSFAAAPTVSRGPAFTDAIVRALPVQIESPVFSGERGRAPPVLS